ncbi:storkhead-box protein 1-like isoform X2 [Limulus polyphemus]|nr:storkhead-box protein 1-like isoform X2 [Limulus polyphemus]
MSPKPNQEDRCANKVVLAQGCLAIIFQRNGENDGGEHNVTTSHGRDHSGEVRLLAEDGYFLFQEFLRENRCCFWNASLSQSVENLQYKGFLTPCTILVTSSMYSLEVIRSAWARRLLHSPTNYNIVKLGDVPCVEMDAVSQVQFAPLGEALCNVIFELNAKQVNATLEVISERLQINFPEMVIPQDEVLYKTLGSLIRDRKLYHSGQGYCVVTPHTYILTSQTTVNERPILMTNEEAIIKLHGYDSFSSEERKHTRTCCVQVDENTNCYGSEGQVLEASKSSGNLERSQSVRLLRVRRRSKSEEHTKISRSGSFKLKNNKRIAQEMNDSKSDLENLDNDKKEKSSVLNWLFRKGMMRAEKRTSKLTTFSAQFPPVSGQDVETVHLHSRGTQTLNEDMFVTSKVNRTSSLSRSSHYGRHSLLLQSTTGVSPPREQRSQTDHHYLISKSASLPRKSYHLMNKICETKYVPYSNNKATQKRNLHHNSPYLESSFGVPNTPGDSVSVIGLDTHTNSKFNDSDFLRKEKSKYPITGANNLQQNTSFNKSSEKASDLYSSSGPKRPDMLTRFTIPQTTKKANQNDVACTENQLSSEIPAS